jgi:hypothetical protein
MQIIDIAIRATTGLKNINADEIIVIIKVELIIVRQGISVVKIAACVLLLIVDISSLLLFSTWD